MARIVVVTQTQTAQFDALPARKKLRLCGKCRCPGHTRGKCNIIEVPRLEWYEDTRNPEEAVICSVARNIVERKRANPNVKLSFRESYLRKYLRDHPEHADEFIHPNPLGYAPLSRRMQMKALARAHDIIHPEWRNQTPQEPLQAPRIVTPEPRPRPTPTPTPTVLEPPPQAASVVEETTCAICLGKLTETNKTIGLCGHQFHTTCAMQWLSRHENCPTCRGQFF